MSENSGYLLKSVFKKTADEACERENMRQRNMLGACFSKQTMNVFERSATKYEVFFKTL